MTDVPTTPQQIADLAHSHGLGIEVEGVRVNEMGLDFRVAIAADADGRRWVLRIPRRPEVMERADVEGRVLAVIARHLDVAVPDWRIHETDLIAYPLLPGTPGLEILPGADGPTWHMDPSSATYAEDLGAVLAQLHAIDPEELRAAGAEIRTADEVRESWRSGIARVTDAFTVAEDLQTRWARWLEDDSSWPDRTVPTHGEIYPAHTLLKDDHITAVLDWTTAAVDDPARDFQFHVSAADPDAVQRTLRSYESHGGHPWPRLAEHAAEMFSASPVSYGLYALETGEQEHLDAAAAALDPQV
jgi:macrolide phosphotransferase